MVRGPTIHLNRPGPRPAGAIIGQPPRQTYRGAGGDAPRWYLTGADGDGGQQERPRLSLGGFRASSFWQPLGFRIVQPMDGLRILIVGGGNGLGVATLTATGANALRWTPPGQLGGDPVEIFPGEIVCLEGDAAGEFVVVYRVRAADLAGSATLELVDTFNNLFTDSDSVETSAGGTEDRCLAIRNESEGPIADLNFALAAIGTGPQLVDANYGVGAVTITSEDASGFADWPATGYVLNSERTEVMYYTARTDSTLTVPAGGRDVWNETAGGAGTGMAGTAGDSLHSIAGLRIGLQAPRTGVNAFTIGEPPVGISWAHPAGLDAADRLHLDSLEAQQMHGVWIERTIPAVAEAAVSARIGLAWEYEAEP